MELVQCTHCSLEPSGQEFRVTFTSKVTTSVNFTFKHWFSVSPIELQDDGSTLYSIFKKGDESSVNVIVEEIL